MELSAFQVLAVKVYMATWPSTSRERDAFRNPKTC
jgi:hypothetical protein